jgi:hypothetical protein
MWCCSVACECLALEYIRFIFALLVTLLVGKDVEVPGANHWKPGPADAVSKPDGSVILCYF